MSPSARRWWERPVRRHAVLAAATVTAVIALFVVLGPLVQSTSIPTASPGPASLQARIAPDRANATSAVIPRSFLGVSTEYWTIPIWAQRLPLLTRVFAQLSQGGTLRLRIGGDSADHTAWAPARELPEWVFELSPEWLTQVTQIVQRTHVHLILDLNLITSTPARAAQWAHVALTHLPRGSVGAFEIGNEPDIYDQTAWRHLTAGPGSPRLPRRFTASDYAHRFAAYARALAPVAPGIPLLAPALAEPQLNLGWVRTLLRASHPGPQGITAHRYPYSACARRGASTYPTIPRVLSERGSAGMGRTALAIERVSDRAHLPLWLTEINSVTCGGTRGVRDTFATALWAPDALMELVRSGAEAASVHVRADAINMAFSLTPRGLVAHPLLYGLILFADTLGPGARLVPVSLRAPRRLRLKAWEVRLDGGIVHLLVLNKGATAARVRITLPLRGPGTIRRLIAPQITSTGGVTLGGQWLTREATWSGRRREERLAPGQAPPTLTLRPYSAALVTAHLR